MARRKLKDMPDPDKPKKNRFKTVKGRMNVGKTQDNRHKRIDFLKMFRGCDRCGWNQHPSAMCFDHKPGVDKHPEIKNFGDKKGGKVGTNAGGFYNLYHPRFKVKELMDEIRKCRCLCNRCHAIKTYPNNPRSKVILQVWKRPEYDWEGEGKLVNDS